MRRALHLGWMLLVLLLLVALSALWFVGWTETGLQLLATNVTRRIGPVTLVVRGARGTLAGGAHFDSLVLDHRRAHVEVTDLNARLALLALLRMTIRVEDASIGSALVQVIPRTNDNSDWEPHFLRAPLVMELPGVKIARATLIAPNGRRWEFTALQSVGSIAPYRISFQSSSADYAGIRIRASGAVLAAKPIGLESRLQFTAQPSGQPLWSAAASIAGNLDRLGIDGAITAPFAADFKGAALELNKQWHWEGDSNVTRLDLRAWGTGDALGVITGKLRLNGDRDGIHARGELLPPGLAAGPLQTEFDGSYAERVITAERLRFTHRPSGTVVTAAGDIRVISPNGPGLALVGNWQSFRWPLADAAAPVHSAAGDFTLDGVWPYRLSARGALQVQQLPAMSFSTVGSLARDRVALEKAVLKAWDGEATLAGVALWSPDKRWQLEGTMRAFNVERARPGVRGRLNFRLSASGEGFGAGGTLRSTIDNLSGEVGGQRASGRARAELAGDDWLLSDVRLQLGGSRINLDGRVGSRIDLRFDVDSDDLALLKAGARGRLRARGAVGGDRLHPVLQLDANGTGIVWDQVSVDTLTAKVALDAGAGSGRADVNLRLGQLRVGERSAETISFSSTGTLAAHTAQLEMVAPEMRLSAAGNGSYNDGLWSWQLQQARAADGRELLLNLEAPALFELAADHLRLEPLCLRGTQARLCGDVRRSDGATALNVSAEMLPLAALTSGLVARTEFDGTLSAEAHLSAAGAQSSWQGSLQSQLVNAVVRHRFSNNRVDSYNLGTGKVDLRLAEQQLTGVVALDAGAAGNIHGNVTAQAIDTNWPSWPLRGTLQLDSDAFDALDSYITEIDRASGRVNADLQLSGTLGSPALNGAIRISGARIDAYAINLALRDLNLDARVNDNVLSLTGTASAGVDGKASIRGQLEARQGQLYGNLHFEGDNLLLVNVFEAKVYASPKLDFKLAARRIDVSGVIDLPYAKLEQPEELATAVRASGDEVVVNSTAAPSDPFRVYSNVTMRLGERVTINTSGLQGRLSGEITATSDESGITRGSGELSIEEGGKYTAYGRKLDISRGRLLFDKSLLGDPAVDLRATKKFPDITVGVNVRGTLSRPRVTLYSDPVVPQQQIVSVLLAGGSLEGIQTGTASDTSGNAARNNAILQGSAILAQQFGNRIGADVSVEQTLQNDTSLVLGRYLSPRLYLSYGIGIAEGLNTIKLNYTVGDHWTIRTEKGKNQSADLVFTIGR